MAEKTKQGGNKTDKKTEKPLAEKTEADDENVWSKDQQRKSYYYDDAYGYEVYDPDQDDEKEEDAEDED